MSVDRPSSSTFGISSAEAKPSVSSVNVHPSSSTSGTPTDAANSKHNSEDEKATSSLCCIPINTGTAATPAAPESKNLVLKLINEIQKDIDQVQMDYDYLKDYRTRVSKQNEEASKMFEKKIEDLLNTTIKAAWNAVRSKNLVLQLVDEIPKDIDPEQMNYDYKDYRTRVSKQNEEASKTLEKKNEDLLKTTIKATSNTVKSLADLLSPSKDKPALGPIETDVQEEIIELKNNVKNIRLQILTELKPQISTSKSHPHGIYRTYDSTQKRRKSKNLDKMVPNLYKNETLARSSDFKNLKELYDGLGVERKLCLLCFSVFPEKEIIKKRFMFYWWTAEGFVAPNEGSEQTAEVLANEVISELMAKRFIEPFSDKRTLAGWVKKYQMHPFVRAAVITLARRAKFSDFDAEGNLYPKSDAEGKPIGNFSSCLVCLLAGEEMLTKRVARNVHMLFNVDETELNFEKPELFSMMKNINLLCLGRWQISPTHHIQVEDTEFLEGLKNMKYLKFLSLQGISHIKDLPNSVSNLTNLMILDIRACPNLEKIPREIGFLKSLTHLDMSECYLLVNMPKEISMLIELEVLKGFVVGESKGKDQKYSCTLGHLEVLTKLRKLSIFTGLKSFPSDSDLRDLNQLKKLLTLSIEWAGVLPDADASSKRSIQPEKLELPQLEKMDLRSFPHRDAPKWLMDSKMNRLKKLYIRGGLLRDLGQYGLQEEREWTVEILRLKFLHNLEMDWRELKKLFPNLIFLEIVRCPKLTFFPCDGQGVWMKIQRNLKLL